MREIRNVEIIAARVYVNDIDVVAFNLCFKFLDRKGSYNWGTLLIDRGVVSPYGLGIFLSILRLFEKDRVIFWENLKGKKCRVEFNFSEKSNTPTIQAISPIDFDDWLNLHVVDWVANHEVEWEEFKAARDKALAKEETT